MPVADARVPRLDEVRRALDRGQPERANAALDRALLAMSTAERDAFVGRLPPADVLRLEAADKGLQQARQYIRRLAVGAGASAVATGIGALAGSLIPPAMAAWFGGAAACCAGLVVASEGSLLAGGAIMFAVKPVARLSAWALPLYVAAPSLGFLAGSTTFAWAIDGPWQVVAYRNARRAGRDAAQTRAALFVAHATDFHLATDQEKVEALAGPYRYPLSDGHVACVCPLSGGPLVDSVIAPDGYTYDREALLRHLARDGHSPFFPDVAIAERDLVVHRAASAWAAAVDEPTAEARRAALECAILFDLPRDPVVDANGHMFDRGALGRYLEQSSVSPLTRAPYGDAPFIRSRLVLQELLFGSRAPDATVSSSDTDMRAGSAPDLWAPASALAPTHRGAALAALQGRGVTRSTFSRAELVTWAADAASS